MNQTIFKATGSTAGQANNKNNNNYCYSQLVQAKIHKINVYK